MNDLEYISMTETACDYSGELRLRVLRARLALEEIYKHAPRGRLGLRHRGVGIWFRKNLLEDDFESSISAYVIVRPAKDGLSASLSIYEDRMVISVKESFVAMGDDLTLPKPGSVAAKLLSNLKLTEMTYSVVEKGVSNRWDYHYTTTVIDVLIPHLGGGWEEDT